MWTFDTHLGLAEILYEPLTGKFLGHFNAECIGRFLTPQRAARAISRLFAAEPAHSNPTIPTDLAFWQTHHKPEFEVAHLGSF
jgi:hypothetical protein